MKNKLVVLVACATLSHNVFAETIANADSKGNQPLVKAAENDYGLVKNLSGTLAFVTNYVFRGQSQTRNLPAVQGGLTYNTPINFYANIWGSNASFVGTTASVEIDTIVGYRNTYGDDFAYDINLARYNYPGYKTYNYNEFNILGTAYFLQAGMSYSGNVYGTHSSGIYYNGGLNYNIPGKFAFGICDLNLKVLMGHYTLPRIAGYSYNDYSAQLTKTYKNYSASVQWTGTNGRSLNPPYDDDQVIGQIAANF